MLFDGAFRVALECLKPLLAALLAISVRLSSTLIIWVRHCAYLRFGLAGRFGRLAALVWC
jgi:hypothetical protein